MMREENATTTTHSNIKRSKESKLMLSLYFIFKLNKENIKYHAQDLFQAVKNLINQYLRENLLLRTKISESVSQYSNPN